MKLRGLVSLVGATAIGLASNASVVAGVGLASVNIVDTPRPQDRWGYAPVTRRIDVGTWVTWSNAGTDAHTVTAADGSFDSGELDPSEGFSWYFDQPGTYDYLCTLHPWMEGTIVVGSGVTAADDTPTVPDDSSDCSDAPAPAAADSGS